MRIELDPQQIDSESGEGLEIAVRGFPAPADGVQIFVEFYNNALQVHIWDGSKEDPVMQYESAPLPTKGESNV